MINFYQYLQFASSAQFVHPNMIPVPTIFYAFSPNGFSSIESTPEITQGIESKLEAIQAGDSEISVVSPKIASQPKKKRLVKKKKDQNFGWRNQNKDRNTMSTILKGFLNSIQHQYKLSTQVDKIIKAKRLSISVTQFKNFIDECYPSRKSYISTKLVQETLLSKTINAQLLLIFRLTLYEYLSLSFPLMVVRMTKLTKKQKIDQMRKGRALLAILFGQ